MQARFELTSPPSLSPFLLWCKVSLCSPGWSWAHGSSLSPSLLDARIIGLSYHAQLSLPMPPLPRHHPGRWHRSFTSVCLAVQYSTWCLIAVVFLLCLICDSSLVFPCVSWPWHFSYVFYKLFFYFVFVVTARHCGLTGVSACSKVILFSS